MRYKMERDRRFPIWYVTEAESGKYVGQLAQVWNTYGAGWIAVVGRERSRRCATIEEAHQEFVRILTRPKLRRRRRWRKARNEPPDVPHPGTLPEPPDR
jgi:hypothetical protein